MVPHENDIGRAIVAPGISTVHTYDEHIGESLKGRPFWTAPAVLPVTALAKQSSDISTAEYQRKKIKTLKILESYEDDEEEESTTDDLLETTTKAIL